jgi:hypothetical protein
MVARIDLTGRIFGKLTVTGFSGRNGKNRVLHWHVRCSCGNERVVGGNNLTSGNSTTCGCRHGVHTSDPILHDELRQLLSYEPVTGKFVWLVDTRNTIAGDEAGHCNPANPYVRIAIGGRSYYAQQLAWFYMTGEWPAEEIDHQDVEHANNKWENIRPATHRQNACNTKVQARNRLGLKGVSQKGERFVAKLTCAGKRQTLGWFPTAKEAALAYDAAAIEKFGEFARTNFEYQ